MKTTELTNAALDWAVAKCEGGDGLWYDTIATHWIKINGKNRALSKGWAQSFTPSTDWAQGGPIIEREQISVAKVGRSADDAIVHHPDCWAAHIDGAYCRYGPTALIAAMRCYVTSKLGDDIEIPTELIG